MPSSLVIAEITTSQIDKFVVGASRKEATYVVKISKHNIVAASRPAARQRPAYAKLEIATENFKRSADSVASTNHRMAATLKTLTTLIQNLPGAVAAGIDPAELNEIKEQLSAIRKELASATETSGTQDFLAVNESLQQLKATIEGTLIVANDQAAHATGQAAQELKELTRVVEGRTGKLTTLVFLSLACSIFAALCAFAGILTMLLKQVK